MDNKFSDIRCILLCKSFQLIDNSYNDIKIKLNQEIGTSVEMFNTLGEYDNVISFDIEEKENLLQSIAHYNKIITQNMNESIFYKSLYIVFPSNGRKDDITKRFWENQAPFFFVSTIHTSHCCVGFDYKESGREYIINKLSLAKSKLNLSFLFRVYYSIDLSEYVVLWKSNEPADVLSAMRILYENEGFVGYTNTISAISDIKKFSNNCINIGEKPFSVTIQAVANSYDEANVVHNRLLNTMKKNYNINSSPYFSFGNYDYICTFNDVLPEAFYDLHNAILSDASFRKSILSLNATIAIPAYSSITEGNTADKDVNVFFNNPDLIKKAVDMKKELVDYCKEIKDEYFEFFACNLRVFEHLHWRKPLSDLLVLLHNMSKSTVFDTVCFLFLDSAHLFLSFLKHIKAISKSEHEMILLLIKNGQSIEQFIREWEQLSERVVRVDGTYQRTPGYESLDYNVSACLVEYHNAYAQSLIKYFMALDSGNDKNIQETKISCFVVPKMCRNFKTTQWFFVDRKKDSMLFITIPMSQMNNPFFIMISLTHEISHYCPNSIRLREKREDTLISCLSVLLCNLLNINTNETIDKCEKLLHELNKDSFLNDNKSNFLVDIKNHLKILTFKLLDDTDKFQELHRAFCLSCNNDNLNKVALATSMRRWAMKLVGFPSDLCEHSNELPQNIYQQIDEIVYFLKEGYADILMIYVLSLDVKDYFKAIFFDCNNLKLPDDNGKLRMKFQRIILVCEALKQAGIWKEEMLTDNIRLDNINEIFSSFKTEYEQWKNGIIEEQWFWYYPKDVFLIIIDYLSECLRETIKRENQLNETANRKKIKNLYYDLAIGGKNGLFSKNFQDTLQENRENILKRWKNRKDSSFNF